MANFEPVPGDKNVLYDPGVGRLLVPLGGKQKIQLYGGASGGWPLTVDVNDRNVAMVRPDSSNLKTWRFIYTVEGVNKGNAMLEARDFGPTCPTDQTQRAEWFSKPVYAYIQVSVVPEFLQSAAPWGGKTYKSTNPMWNNVQWTNMAAAGCGPTSLAIIMDYITTWDKRYPKLADGTPAPNVTPLVTMDYTSRYGRAADDKGQPSGTDGAKMMAHLNAYWSGYDSEKLAAGKGGVDLAERYLKSGEILLFLMNNGDTYKYDAKGNKQTSHWGGHFMVLIGVNSTQQDKSEEFFIADPSLARTQFVSRGQLESTCQIWRVTRDPAFDEDNQCRE